MLHSCEKPINRLMFEMQHKIYSACSYCKSHAIWAYIIQNQSMFWYTKRVLCLKDIMHIHMLCAQVYETFNAYYWITNNIYTKWQNQLCFVYLLSTIDYHNIKRYLPHVNVDCVCWHKRVTLITFWWWIWGTCSRSFMFWCTWS